MKEIFSETFPAEGSEILSDRENEPQSTEEVIKQLKARIDEINIAVRDGKMDTEVADNLVGDLEQQIYANERVLTLEKQNQEKQTIATAAAELIGQYKREIDSLDRGVQTSSVALMDAEPQVLDLERKIRELEILEKMMLTEHENEEVESADVEAATAPVDIMEETVNIDDESLGIIVKDKLSYQDANVSPEQREKMLRNAKENVRARKYAKYLSQIPPEKVEQAVEVMMNNALAILDAAGVTVSPYGTSKSWAYWDLGKQQAYYEENKQLDPREDNPYIYEPGLEKVDEIVDRHVGWELYHSPDHVKQKVVSQINDPETAENIKAVLQLTPKIDGQLRSYEYAELGRLLRQVVFAGGNWLE